MPHLDKASGGTHSFPLHDAGDQYKANIAVSILSVAWRKRHRDQDGETGLQENGTGDCLLVDYTYTSHSMPLHEIKLAVTCSLSV